MSKVIEIFFLAYRQSVYFLVDNPENFMFQLDF
jgi:hypothetical protein